MKTKLVKEVLMCKPLHFSVDYSINPWMKPGSVDKEKAMQQWEILVQAYKSQDVFVHSIDQAQGVPDMVFSTDHGITRDKKVLVSNFRYPERQKEAIHYRSWFENNNYMIKTLPVDVFLEGSGESLFWRDILFVGNGYRSSKNSAEAIASLLDITVIPLELIDPRFYHLDIALFPLNHDIVFYYPNAFSAKSKKILKERIPQLFEFTDEEVFGFSANSVVTDHHVILQKNNPTFKQKLKSLGYTPIEIDVSEFLKAGGGIHCLTQILREENIN